MFGFKKHFKNLLIRYNIISPEFLDIISKYHVGNSFIIKDKTLL
jgi:hypothetical protein